MTGESVKLHREHSLAGLPRLGIKTEGEVCAAFSSCSAVSMEEWLCLAWVGFNLAIKIDKGETREGHNDDLPTIRQTEIGVTWSPVNGVEVVESVCQQAQS